MALEGPVISPDLAAMIGSRICHDLVSPVGAIANGVELMTMSGMASPELALIADSVANANARLRFFRIAFGQASPGQGLGRSEIVSVLDDLYKGGRLTVTWLPQADQSRSEVRLAFLLILCLETAMPYGGEIRISRGEGHWHVEGEGRKTKQDEELWRSLQAVSVPEVGASDVHFALLVSQAARLGRGIRLDRTPTRIAVTL